MRYIPDGAHLATSFPLKALGRAIPPFRSVNTRGYVGASRHRGEKKKIAEHPSRLRPDRSETRDVEATSTMRNGRDDDIANGTFARVTFSREAFLRSM